MSWHLALLKWGLPIRKRERSSVQRPESCSRQYWSALQALSKTCTSAIWTSCLTFVCSVLCMIFSDAGMAEQQLAVLQGRPHPQKEDQQFHWDLITLTSIIAVLRKSLICFLCFLALASDCISWINLFVIVVLCKSSDPNLPWSVWCQLWSPNFWYACEVLYWCSSSHQQLYSWEPQLALIKDSHCA